LKASAKAVFGEAKPPKFGEVIYSFDATGWVNGLAFSPSGNVLAATMQDSRMQFITIMNADGFSPEPLQNHLRLKGLPATKLAFLDENTCVGGGCDMVPLKFTSNGSGEWTCQGSMDQGRAKKAGKKGAAAMWADKTDRAGQEAHAHTTTHENMITSIFIKAGSNSEFTTAGLDGRVCFWNASLEASFKNLNLRQP